MQKCDMKLSKLVRLYIDHRMLKPVSAKTVRSACKRVSDFMGEDPKLADITLDVVVSWRHHMGQRVRTNTYNSYLTAIQSVMRYAVTVGLCNKLHPLLGLRKGRVDRQVPATVQDEFFVLAKDFLSHPAQLGDRNLMEPRWFWWSVIETLAYTGMRRHQLCELRWKDIDFDADLIDLRREGSKSGKAWVIPLPDVVKVSLLELKRRTLQVVDALEPQVQVFNLALFSTAMPQHCTGLRENHLTARLIKISKIIGIKGNAHRFRHTAATRWMNESGQLKTVKAILGHSSEKASLQYINPDMVALREGLEGLL